MKVISDVPVSRSWYKIVSKELSFRHKLKFSNPYIFELDDVNQSGNEASQRNLIVT